MNNALTHTGSLLPTIGFKSDGNVLVLTDTDCDCDEPTRTDIKVPSFTSEDNWCDGLTMFALILSLIGFAGACAFDMGDKAAARAERVRLDQNCLLTYK
jgi:hypothetical protein